MASIKERNGHYCVIYNVPITVDTRISVVPFFRTPTQDVTLFLNTVPM